MGTSKGIKKMKYPGRLIFFILLYFFWGESFCFAGIESDPLKRFHETDLDCILYSIRKIDGCPYPKGTFFVFLGLDEENRIRCEPLSGARQRWTVEPALLLKTGYRKDTPCYEIALDAYKIFAEYSSLDEKNGEYQRKLKLLQVMGRQSLVLPLQQMADYERQCNKILEDGCRELRITYAKAIKNDDFDADEFYELGDKIGEKISDRIEKSLELVKQAADNNNILLATSLYLNFAEYWKGTRKLRRNFQVKKVNLLSALEETVKTNLEQCAGLVITCMADRCTNAAFQENEKDFHEVYPDARGLWNESPPNTARQIRSYFNRFFFVRREMNEYSAVSDFEKWGNCRLGVLSFTQSFAEADYLDREFHDALKKHKILFPKKK